LIFGSRSSGALDDPSEEATNHHDHAVVIGIRRYSDSSNNNRWITDLKGPDNDAEAVAKWLRDPDGGGLPTDNVKVARSADYPNPFEREVGPHQRAVHDAFTLIAKHPRQAYGGQYTGRRLYIYISGHGHAQTRNQAALLTADAEWEDPRSVLINSWLDWFWHEARFQQFVLWADCCATRVPPAAAAFSVCSRRRRNAPNAGNGLLFEAFAAPFGLKAVERRMDEDGKCHGVFTWALLKGLKGAAARDGKITSYTLRDYLNQSMVGFMRDDQKVAGIVATEPAFGTVNLFDIKNVPEQDWPLFSVTLHFPISAVGKYAAIGSAAFRPPTLEATLTKPEWRVWLGTGKYWVFVPDLDLACPVLVTGGSADNVFVAS
jgi:hypothetical protein